MRTRVSDRATFEEALGKATRRHRHLTVGLVSLDSAAEVDEHVRPVVGDELALACRRLRHTQIAWWSGSTFAIMTDATPDQVDAVLASDDNDVFGTPWVSEVATSDGGDAKAALRAATERMGNLRPS